MSQSFNTASLSYGEIVAMNKFLRIGIYTVAIVLTIAFIAIVALQWNSHRKLNRVFDVVVAPVPYATGVAVLTQGSYLYNSRGCAECHGADGAGRTFIDDPNGLFARSANLTRGNGSAVLSYTELDWVRAIRHGVKPDGRPLFVMPSEDYSRLSNDDLAALVAYTRSLPPQDAHGTDIRLPLIVKLAHGAGVLKDAAEKIDHSVPPSLPVPAAPTVDHGRYVAQTCIGCHGPALHGGRIPGAPPDWPPATKIVACEGSAISRYRDVANFNTMMRTGVRPDGTQVNLVMPFESLKHLNDTDLDALYVYLTSPK